MKNTIKKILCALLVVVMCLTSAPLSGFVGLELPEFSVSEWFSNKASAASEGYYTYTITDGEATITDVNTLISGDITIPATLGGYSVTTIGDYAFECCYSLTSVTIPDSVTTIGEGAFYSCYSLTSVTIGDSVTTIGDYAFYSCDSLTSVTIPDSVTTIGYGPFCDCDSLTSITVDINNVAYSNDIRGVLFDKNKTVLIQYPAGNNNISYTIPDSVTTIGDYAFYYCYSLTSVTIGNNVTTIGDFAFGSCGSLTSVTIPDSVTTIGDYTFEHCFGLTSVTIGNSVTTIGDYAFERCYWLTSVTIPDSVTTIGNYAFYDCRCLTSVTIPNSITTIGDYAFCDCDSLTDVYYQGTEEQWNNISIGDDNEGLTGATIYYKHNHTYTSEITTPATHLTEGVKTYTCECGDSYIEAIAKLEGHTYTSEVTKEATHLEEGETTYTCACGDSYTEAIVKLEGHTFKEVTTEPTCITKGYTAYSCECGYSYVDYYVDKLGHDMGDYTVTTAPTCTEKGEETSYCSRCDYTEKRDIDIIAHSYEPNITEPTCTDQGYTTYTCECGDTYIDDYVEANGHTFTTYISDGKATCTTDGLKIAKCDYCEVTDSIPEKGGHSYSDKWTIDIEPTCTSEGLKSHHCLNCEENTDITPIGKLAHTYNKTIIDPTCADKGYNVYTCSCGDTYTETIEALGHSFDGSECINCDFDKADDCSCNCHKGGIAGLIWKILNFFYKLFRMNEECVCGAEHW